MHAEADDNKDWFTRSITPHLDWAVRFFDSFSLEFCDIFPRTFAFMFDTTSSDESCFCLMYVVSHLNVEMIVISLHISTDTCVFGYAFAAQLQKCRSESFRSWFSNGESFNAVVYCRYEPYQHGHSDKVNGVQWLLVFFLIINNGSPVAVFTFIVFLSCTNILKY